jgi:hypothetical protein
MNYNHEEEMAELQRCIRVSFDDYKKKCDCLMLLDIQVETERQNYRDYLQSREYLQSKAGKHNELWKDAN